MTKQFYILFSLLIFISQQAIAQEGKFDLHFLLNGVDCQDMKVKVDIILKAADANSVFNLAEQNYRFSFQREAVSNPVISEELDISGVIELPDGNIALYSPHSLFGSIDTVISYNVELQSDYGYGVTETEWANVGRMSFDIENTTQCLNLIWHRHDTDFFPNTIITEKFGDALHYVDEGTYVDLEVCFYDFCASPPIAQDDYITVPIGQTMTFDLLENDNDLDGNLDPSTFSLVNMPPASQMTVATTTDAGKITCTPAAGFQGVVNAFEYEICDGDSQCVTAKVFAEVMEVTDINTPDDKYDIRLSPTAANDYVAVEYLNITAQAMSNIAITDVNGRMLQTHEKSISGNAVYRFDVSNLTQGVYFLSTMIEGTWVSRKFIKL